MPESKRTAITEAYAALSAEISKAVVGQESLIRSLCVALFASGHVLLEGVPGLAKTLAAESLAASLGLSNVRIQFTPDLLPSDIVGTETYRPQTGEFSVRKGSIFASVVVADEINRAPSKVQSALLEAMQEHQVSIAGETFALPEPFFVVATMNPLEEEGTYPLPEASLDRFLLKVRVEYPDRSHELEIMRRMASGNAPKLSGVLNRAEVSDIRRQVEESTYADEKVYAYVADLVSATRNPAEYGLRDIAEYVAYGVSPRASVGLVRASKALAAISGRDYVIPEDVRAVAPEVLRHRIGLSFEGISKGISPDRIVHHVLSHVPLP